MMSDLTQNPLSETHMAQFRDIPKFYSIARKFQFVNVQTGPNQQTVYMGLLETISGLPQLVRIIHRVDYTHILTAPAG